MTFPSKAQNSEAIKILIKVFTFTLNISSWQGKGVERNPDYNNCNQDDNGIMYIKKPYKSGRKTTNNRT